MRTIIDFSDRGSGDLAHLASDIQEYADEHELDIIHMSNMVQFVHGGKTITQCIVVFKEKEQTKFQERILSNPNRPTDKEIMLELAGEIENKENIE